MYDKNVTKKRNYHYKKEKNYFFLYIKINKKDLIFGDKKSDRNIIIKSKQSININEVDVNKIVVSKK